MQLRSTCLLFLAMAFQATLLPGQELIETADALKYSGRTVRVRFTVNSIDRNGEFQNLNSEDTWDAPGNLVIQIGPELTAEFMKRGIQSPNLHFLRKPIEVTGVVHEHRPGGKLLAAIELKSVDDIEFVLESARAPTPVAELVDRRIDLHLRDGKRIGNVLVTSLESGLPPESIVSLTVQIGDAPPKLYRASLIEEVVSDGIPLDLAYDRRRRLLAVDMEQRLARQKTDEETELRLLGQGRRLWPRFSEQEQTDWLTKHREFVNTVKQQFPDKQLRVIESSYYLVLTDLSDRDAKLYFGYLDTLYEEMCRAFGIPEGSNIWCGKCVVFAFQKRADFIRFEVDIMNNQSGTPAMSGADFRCDNDGVVMVSLFKEDLTTQFATLLVHETAKGVMARCLSNVRLPAWLDAGMAVWIAEAIVKQDDRYENLVKESATALKQQQTLAGFFQAEQVPGEHYGCAAAMVNLLIRQDRDRFRRFFTGIKLGHDAEDALRDAYMLSFDDLAQAYGRTIGLANLRP